MAAGMGPKDWQTLMGKSGPQKRADWVVLVALPLNHLISKNTAKPLAKYGGKKKKKALYKFGQDLPLGVSNVGASSANATTDGITFDSKRGLLGPDGKPLSFAQPSQENVDLAKS